MITQERKTDPRAIRTRQLLTQAFVELLQQKSFQSITVQDIATRATVNRATFYAHFEDKHALLNHAIRDAFRQTLAGLPGGAGIETENVRKLLLTLCDFMAEFHRHCIPKDRQILPLLEVTITTELYDVLLSWLKSGRSEPGRRSAPLEMAAMVASWAMYGAATQWAREKRPGSAKEFVDQVLPMIMTSLSQAVRSYLVPGVLANR